MKTLITITVALCLLHGNASGKMPDQLKLKRNNIKDKYQPTWDSLDSRPNPDWYDSAKFGIFLHWGVYSVPSYGSEWFWLNWKANSAAYVEFMNKLYPPGFSYQSFAPEFKAEFFNADTWAEILEGSGAKYVVMTSKHHEGFTLWPSSYTFSWNAMDVGPHRDLIKEVSEAIRKSNQMRFGVYYSLYEWFNPLYLQDKASNFTSKIYVDEKMIPELVELVEKYRPEVVWTDGDWEAEETYWRSREILSWLFNKSPVKDSVVTNDRWGKDIPCHHGGVFTCTDRYNPQTLQKHKWENCMTVDKVSWGFRRNARLADYLSVNELIKELVTTVSCGGNLLLNVGPTKEGTIAPIFEDRLLGMGRWLQLNGEAIYNTKPWIYQNDTANGNVWYTSSKQEHKVLSEGHNELEGQSTVYAIVLEWPKNKQLFVKGLYGRLNLTESKMYILGNEKTLLKWTQDNTGVWISFPDMDTVKSQLSWSIKVTNVRF